MAKWEQIVAEVHEQWVAAGKLHDPPDDTSRDDDLGMWNEVQRRLADQNGTSELPK